MDYNKEFKIYTDASFDDKTKIGTYAIVITQENKIIKAFGKKCKIKLENSTECEIFAIFQVLNLINSNLIKDNINQKFYIRTDCNVAIPIFKKNNNTKLFNNNIKLLSDIKKSYHKVKTKLNKENSHFELQWISRKSNKIAHKYSYNVFKKIKMKENENNISLSEIKKFLNLLQSNKANQYKIIAYLLQISNEEKFILKTQNEIATTLKISIYTVNKAFKEFIKLNVIQKIKNGKYLLLL